MSRGEQAKGPKKPGPAPTGRSAALASLDRNLIHSDEPLARLFWPPFDETTLDPGYIRVYPPGLRENGGQYGDAAMWAILAFAKLSPAARPQAWSACCTHQSRQQTADAEAYKVEPCVAAADIYSVGSMSGAGDGPGIRAPPALMYCAGIEGILGIRGEGAWVVLVVA